MRIERTRRGARIVDDDVTISEILAEPGPTHSLFDVLAACVAALAPGPRTVLLGFAGGGMVAPLRAMGYPHPLDAVDLDGRGERLFREVCGPRGGEVRFFEGDAVAWLKRSRRRWDVVVEDLSAPSPAGTVKPYASFDPLPALIRRRLRRNGLAVVNLLPLPGTPWPSLLAHVSAGHLHVQVVHLEEYENRFVLAGDALPAAAETSARVRAALRGIGSDQARRLSVRTLRA